MTYLPLNAIRAFEATARRLSFSAAGEELHVTHAAISHQVKRLEEWLGVSLFDRGARQVQLTEQGAAMLAAASAALADLETTCRRIRRHAGREPLTVGCIPSIASRWLVPRLSGFTAAHPGIDIRVVYAKAEDRLADGDSDVLITLGADPSAGVASRRLFSRMSLPVCSPHHLAGKPALATAEGMASATLLHDETRQGWRDWFRAAGLSNANVDDGPVFADFNLMIGSLIGGQGVGLCPTALIAEEIAAGSLVSLFEQACDMDKAYWLIEAKGLSREARTLRDWLLGARQEER